jgi:hypothetical protein
LLAGLVAEIEVTGHRSAEIADDGLRALDPAQARASGTESGDGRGSDAELHRLAQGAALQTVLGTAARLRMPDLLAFLG